MSPIAVLEMIDRPFLGGGQMTVLALAKNLDREKFTVAICSAEGGPLIEEAKRSGIPHFAASFHNPLGGKSLKRIASLLQTNQIDILHTHGGVAGFYGRRAARKAGTQVIIHTLHGIHYLHYRNPLLVRAYTLLERHCSKFTDAVIVVSEADRETALRNRLAPPSKIVLIKNGVDFSRLVPLQGPEKKRRELGLDAKQPVIGTVARLHLQKGLIYLLRASKLVRQEFPQIKVMIAGGGPLRSHLARQAQRLGIEDIVVFLGERDDIPDLLSIFDIFALPSLWEGLPYALVEAAALARPVVATDIDGVREVIRDGETGLLVPAGDPSGLAEAIIRLLQDKEKAQRFGTKAREIIPPQYELSRMISETQSLYMRTKQAKSVRFL